MKTLLNTIALIILTALTLSGQPSKRLQNKIKVILSEPCSKEIELIKDDSIKSAEYIRKIEKEIGLQFETYSNKQSSEIGTTDYVLLIPGKSITWSIWFSLGSKGIRHITETWQSTSELLLQTKLYESMKQTMIKKGYFDEVNEEQTFFVWNKNSLNCNKTMVTIVRDKGAPFVSRRTDYK